MRRLLAALVMLVLGTVAATAASQEPNTNRPGGDFTSVEIRRPAPEACASLCQGNAQCFAWTYVKPGIQGRRARCWLKNRIPAAVPDACCTSGVTRLMPFPGKTKLPL
jgi:hypothetical protein